MAEPARPLVSIIVPCYNGASYLAGTLDNVRAQTWSRWECLVVDDGSTDQTSAVVATYAQHDPRFKYGYQQNAGLSAARNHGLRKAQGQFIQLLDADDALASRKLENQIAILERDPATDIVFSWVEFFGDVTAQKIAQYSSGLLRESKSAREALRLLVRQNFMVVNAPLVRKTLMDKVGLFDESLFAVEDWNYWIRCALAGAHFVYDDQATSLARVRLHPHSLSTNPQRMFVNSLQVREQLAVALAGLVQLPDREALISFNQEVIRELFKRLDALKNAPAQNGACSRASKALGWLRKAWLRT